MDACLSSNQRQGMCVMCVCVCRGVGANGWGKTFGMEFGYKILPTLTIKVKWNCVVFCVRKSSKKKIQENHMEVAETLPRYEGRRFVLESGRVGVQASTHNGNRISEYSCIIKIIAIGDVWQRLTLCVVRRVVLSYILRMNWPYKHYAHSSDWAHRDYYVKRLHYILFKAIPWNAYVR